jgi:dihydrofolate synthase/folylpolyglutamate synthase
LLDAGVAETAILECPDVAAATATAVSQAGEADRIVIFGSFVTVAAALQALETMQRTRA